MTSRFAQATDEQILAIADLSGDEQLAAALLLALDLGIELEGARAVAMIGTELTLELGRRADGSFCVEGIRRVEGGEG